MQRVSLIAAQLSEAAKKPRTPCLVGRFIAEHCDDEDRRVIDAMLADRRKGATVHRILTDNGLDASASAVGIHRRGACGCRAAEAAAAA